MLDKDKLYVVSSDYDGWEYAIATPEKVIKTDDTWHDPHFMDFAHGFAYGRGLDVKRVVISDTKDLEDNRQLLEHVGLYDTYKDSFEEIYG